MNSLNDRVVECALNWAKHEIRYSHRGHSRFGCDCSGLVIGICEELGLLHDFEMPLYPIDWLYHEECVNNITAILPQYSNEVHGTIIPGDIALFKFVKVLSHLGIYVGNNIMIHSQLGLPVRKAPLITRGGIKTGWSKRLDSIWRLDERKFSS